MLLVVVGIQEYYVWSQITDLYRGLDYVERWELFLNLILGLHPHALRAFLLLPIYLISDISSVDLDIVFGIFVVLNVYVAYRIVVYISAVSFFINLLILCCFFTLLLFMNGRISFAIFGNAIILYALFKNHYLEIKGGSKFAFLVFLGLLCCSVSSGTIFVAIGFLFCFYALRLLLSFPKADKKTIFYFVLMIILVVFFGMDMLMVYIYKNLAYYDDSFYKMLSHGAGKYISPYFLIFVPILLVGFYLIIGLLKKHPLLVLPSALVFSSLVVGLFGFSSLVSGISGFILLILLYVKKNHTKQYYS